MDSKLNIFVEGKCDEKFLTDFISHHFGADIDIRFQKLSGDLHNIPKLKAKFHEGTSNGFTNLIVIDADSNKEETERILVDIIDQNGLTCDYFIMPNNQDAGNLENLRIQIVDQDKAGIMDCFDQYSNCVEKLGYKSPDLKSKLYAYLECLEADVGCSEIDYLNDNWNLESDYLTPLNDFFGNHIKK